MPAVIFEEHLQLPQFIERSHISCTPSKTRVKLPISTPTKWAKTINSWNKRKNSYRVRSICAVKASKFEAQRASVRSTWGLPGDCSRPVTIQILWIYNYKVTVGIWGKGKGYDGRNWRVYQSAMHVKGVMLNAGDPFGEPFLFVLDSVRFHHFSLYFSNSVEPQKPSRYEAWRTLTGWTFGSIVTILERLVLRLGDSTATLACI